MHSLAGGAQNLAAWSDHPARLVARIRDRTAARLWKQLSALPDADQRERLEALLVVPPEGRLSPLDRLRRGPTRMSAPGLVSALQRLQEIRALGVGKLDLRAIPQGRSLKGDPSRAAQGAGVIRGSRLGTQHRADAVRPMEEAANHLRTGGVVIAPEDLARLSPLGHGHINFLGRYLFALAEQVAQGQLRPLILQQANELP